MVIKYDKYVLTDDGIIEVYLKGVKQFGVNIPALLDSAGYRYVGSV